MTDQSQQQKGNLYRWYVVGVLTFAYLVSFLDRQILALMVGPIQQDLMLTDTQMSLLMGLAFSIFYIFIFIHHAMISGRTDQCTSTLCTEILIQASI